MPEAQGLLLQLATAIGMLTVYLLAARQK